MYIVFPAQEIKFGSLHPPGFSSVRMQRGQKLRSPAGGFVLLHERQVVEWLVDACRGWEWLKSCPDEPDIGGFGAEDLGHVMLAQACNMWVFALSASHICYFITSFCNGLSYLTKPMSCYIFSPSVPCLNLDSVTLPSLSLPHIVLKSIMYSVLIMHVSLSRLNI